MSVTNTSIKTSYIGNGVTVAFSTNFPVIDFTDVQASLTGTAGTYNCTYGTDYTVSGDVTTSAVTVTFVVAPASGIQVLIYRVEPLTQVDNFVDNARWTGADVTSAFDKLTMISQQLQDQSNRSIQFPIADTGSATNVLPTLASRAGMLLGFDASGDPVAITQFGKWRGNWTTGATYYYADTVQDPATLSLYYVTAQPSYISGTSVAADVSGGYLLKMIDATVISANAGSAASSAASALVSANNAGTSANNAAVSAAAALVSANNAGTSASNAAASATLAASYVPSNSGQSGNFLTNNGTANNWAAISQVPSNAGQSGNFLTNNGTANNWAAVAASANYAHGQCRLVYTSSSQLTLNRYGGPGFIQINGTAQQLPSGGVTLANTGLTAATLYYVYAYMNSGTMTLEAVVTTHTTSNGIEIKSGDATRTLVGMVYMGAGSPGTFVDSSSQRYVASYFNRRNRELVGQAQSASTTSTSDVVLQSGNNATCVTWADEASYYSINAYVSASGAGIGVIFIIGLDGSQIGQFGYATWSTGGLWTPATVNATSTFAEGFHTLTALGRVSAGTGSYNNILGQGIIRQ